MLVRREAMEKVGLMDERFFLYFEDTDWCFRMKKMGWGVYYVPDSVMIHHYERSSAGSMLRLPFIIHLLSLLRYYEKWNRISYILRRNRGPLKFLLFVLGDLAAINASFFAAYLLRDLFQPFFERGLYPVSWYAVYIVFSNVIYFLAFLYSGLYRIRRETPPRSEFLRIARAILLGFVIVLAATYLSRVRIHSRAVLLGQAALTIPAVFLVRQLFRAAHRMLVRARLDLKRTLLVGTNKEIAEYAPRLAPSSAMGIDIVKMAADPASAPSVLDELLRIVETLMIQEVYMLPSFQTDEFLDSLLERSKGKMIQIKAVSPLSHFAGGDVRVEGVGGISLFSIERRSRR
jgi:FlaA1/EpsC-like NDP-sugar epimerase